MTIIVAYQGVMVADSSQIEGSRKYRCAEPKIIRCDDGGLVGCTGRADDCHTFAQWAKGGFPVEQKPTITDDDFRALHLGKDGHCRIFYTSERSFPATEPAIVGESTAASMVIGAMKAGADIARAVELACEDCIWIGGPVQVERIGQAPSVERYDHSPIDNRKWLEP